VKTEADLLLQTAGGSEGKPVGAEEDRDDD